MATRKSPARGTGSRPAKTTTAIGKPRAAAKKSVKVSAKPAAVQPSPEADSNVVQLPPVEATPVTAEKPAELAPIAEEVTIEEVTAKAEPVVAPPASFDEPATIEEVAAFTPAEEAPELDATVDDNTVEDEIVEEPEVEMTFKPNAFSGASLFPGFPQFPNMPEFPAFGAVDMNAFVASGTAMVEGMQSIGQELMDFSRKTAERNVETTMAVFGASSVQEAIDVQSSHATGSLNDLVSESTKLSGMAMDVASKAASSFTRS